MTDPTTQAQITRHLQDLRRGDASAHDRLLPDVYEELRKLADRAARDQYQNHTLQPTVLVHDAYMRLVGSAEGAVFEDRKHFFNVASIAMRQLLINYARERGAQKRGGDRKRVELVDEAALTSAGTGLDLVELNDALTELAELAERQARVVELRFLAGLTVEETAEALEVSARTVALDWKMARRWLQQRLSGGEAAH